MHPIIASHRIASHPSKTGLPHRAAGMHPIIAFIQTGLSCMHSLLSHRMHPSKTGLPCMHAIIASHAPRPAWLASESGGEEGAVRNLL